MESNDFEKEVSQKLGELKISPQEEVWSRIEKEIAPKRGTRTAILAFLLLLLISAGGAWWLTHRNFTSKSPSTIQNVVKRENKSEAKGITSPQVQKNEKTIDADVAQSQELETSASSLKAESSSNNLKEGISNKLNPSFSQKPTRSFTAKPTNTWLTKPTEEVVPANESSNEVLNEIHVPGELITVPWFEDFSSSKDFNSQTLNTAPQLTLTLKKQKIIKHKWTMGFTISGGSLWIESKTGSPMYAYNVPTSSFNTAYVYYPLRSSYIYYPSRPSSFQTSFAFTAGVFAERNLTAKTSLSLGLSYSHLAVQNNVRNNFEFVQLPVAFHFRVNRNDHLPVTFDAGVTASQLAGSNAQQYNYFSDRWYHDNDLFNKFQANLHTGFSFTVFNKQGKQIRVGPGFSYGLTQMATQGIYEGKHWHVLNVHAEMLLRKK